PVVQRVHLPVSLLHAGSTGDEVERVLGPPTVATELGGPESGDVSFLYADQPVRTRVVLKANRVASVALDVVYINSMPLPPRARPIKPTMVRDGVTRLLGPADSIQQWMEANRQFEQMTFGRAGEPEFSVFLADGFVVDVRLGHEKPPGLASMLVPAASTANQLGIGSSAAQIALFVGPLEYTTRFTLKGQPAEYATYRERDGDGDVTITFVGGVVTAFTIWPPEL
ncbi:MAG: hypothetical protein JO227_04410, partial [Acetobacteraceae bacterium]|nr:hypothetical protein [Acetobacteraceae bacterium]